MAGFETPFSQTKHGSEFYTPDQEQLKVVDVEFETERDMITYRKKFEGGSVGKWQELPGVQPDQPAVFMVKKQELRRKLGLREQSE